MSRNGLVLSKLTLQKSFRFGSNLKLELVNAFNMS